MNLAQPQSLWATEKKMASTGNPRGVLLIGGVGGSGTRVVASIINELGIYIGSNLNRSFDNLDWPGNIKLLLDKAKSDEDKMLGLAEDFKPFAEKMLRGAKESGKPDPFWATKVPGSFYYLPYLTQLYDNILYIHIVRHGLDMAFSNNQNQLYNWGSFFGLAHSDNVLPKNLLKYWARANAYALEQCNKWLPGRHMLVRLEDLCSNKENSIRRMANFVGKADQCGRLDTLNSLIKTPETIGRYKRLGRSDMFDQVDIETLSDFGYEVEW